jgi:hypothetical protein
MKRIDQMEAGPKQLLWAQDGVSPFMKVEFSVVLKTR